MLKILVIDDSAFLRHYVRMAMEEAGFVVEDFLPTGTVEVQEKLKAMEPDLVLTDFNMPNLDGLTVTRTVRRHSTTLPIVVLTAARDPERDSRLQGYAPLTVLHKPITGEELVQALQGILAGE